MAKANLDWDEILGTASPAELEEAWRGAEGGEDFARWLRHYAYRLWGGLPMWHEEPDWQRVAAAVLRAAARERAAAAAALGARPEDQAG